MIDPEAIDEIERRLSAELGGEALVQASPLDATLFDLLPDERPLAERAVEKRLREFATGRRSARHLLERLGFAPGPLLRRRDRVPRWPEGATGSISHTDDLCVVAVARVSAVPALGLDVEQKTPLEERLWDLVLRPKERDWLLKQPAEERGDWAKVVFSAKECTYKCQYTLTGRTLEFSDVELRLDPLKQRFFAVLLPLQPAVVEGVCFSSGRWIVCGARAKTGEFPGSLDTIA